MIRLIMRWVTGVIAVAITVWLAGLLNLRLQWPSTLGIVIFVPVLAIANAVIGPILRILSLPITCLTLGLFGFVINAFLFWLAGSITGAEMTFLSALFGSICVTIIGGVLSQPFKESD